MLIRSLHTSLRYFLKHKAFGAINIVGLTLGLLISFYALHYIRFELSYDHHNEKIDRIYRLVTNLETPEGQQQLSTTGGMGPAISQALPEVELTSRIFLDYLLIGTEDGPAFQQDIAYADPQLFTVFTMPLIHGNANNLLSAPYDIVISESAALKFFGRTDVLDKTLVVNGETQGRITGVMQDLPNNSHLKVDMILPVSTLGEGWNNNWKRYYFYTYLLLNKEANPEVVQQKLGSILTSNMDLSLGTPYFTLEPLEDVYLQGSSRASRTGESTHGSMTNIRVFALIAAFVLLLAIFNFINLSTAFAAQRVKEIGVRKALGATRKMLVRQFLTDAVFLSLVALIGALLVSLLILPMFNQLTGKEIITSIMDSPQILALLLGISLLTGLGAGTYPALFLSDLKPSGSSIGVDQNTSNALLRKTLVVVQFTISITLVISTMIVNLQLHFMKTHELGFNKAHQLVADFQFNGDVIDRREVIKQELEAIAGVEQVAFSSSIPGKGNHKYPIVIEDINNESKELLWDSYFVSHDFLQQYKIEIIAGEPLRPSEVANAGKAMLINKAATKALGLENPAEAIGKRYTHLRKQGTVVGVINDFHFQPFHQEVKPLVIRVANGFLTMMSVRVTSRDMQSTISQIEGKWKNLGISAPFTYFFADQAFDQQYKAEDRFQKLVSYFSLLAILISCLGLLGLSMHYTAMRTKEIGVRKILGASSFGIVLLLNRQFSTLILLASIFGSVLSYFAMNSWLNDFAYRVQMPWWAMGVGAFLLTSIAVATVSLQGLQTSRMNPSRSLRES